MTPPPRWRIILDSPCPATEQMARDVTLATEAIPTVRLFRWDPPAISFARAQTPPTWLQEAQMGADLEGVQRPTGGGIAFHGSDVSCSVVVPSVMGYSLRESMERVCESAATLCLSYGVETTVALESVQDECITYCLTQPSPYALYIDGCKVAGFAVRRYPEMWLIQGSLLVRPLPRALIEVVPGEVQEQLAVCARPLSVCVTESVDEGHVADRWAEHWSAWWEQRVEVAVH